MEEARHKIERRSRKRLEQHSATEDWKRVFVQMAIADVFIMAKSSFSHSAAYHNANCVIRSPNDIKHTPISKWILVSEPKDQDRAYTKIGTVVNEDVYNSRYNKSHISVVNQNHRLPFISQLRQSLFICSTESALVSKDGRLQHPFSPRLR